MVVEQGGLVKDVSGPSNVTLAGHLLTRHS